MAAPIAASTAKLRRVFLFLGGKALPGAGAEEAPRPPMTGGTGQPTAWVTMGGLTSSYKGVLLFS